jgi:anti-sigma B factor antagonist
MAEFATATGPDEAVVLLVSGDLDIASEQDLLGRATALLDAGAALLDVDLGEVTFLDSSGLGALVRARQLAHERGRELRLASVPRSVARILELTGLADLFPERPQP